MVGSFASTSWADVEKLREAISVRDAGSVEEKAQQFATLLTTSIATIVLTRVFLVLPLQKLDADATAFLKRNYVNEPRLKPTTSVLTLLGTAGQEAAWNVRANSSGHLAIPLLDREFVEGIPMIAKLLGDLESNLANLDSGLPIVSRRLLGGLNGTFFVPDAPAMLDAHGRNVISSTAFVKKHGVRSVFGMGGAYQDGTLAVAVVFTRELIDRLIVDRFPSLIGNFKIATADLVASGKIFRG